jgi:hypothetical protein
VPAPRVLAPLPHATATATATVAAGAHAANAAAGCTSELGRVWLADVDKRVELHVFATSAAVQVDAQVQDTGIRMSLGPPPWRPPE